MYDPTLDPIQKEKNLGGFNWQNLYIDSRLDKSINVRCSKVDHFIKRMTILRKYTLKYMRVKWYGNITSDCLEKNYISVSIYRERKREK